MTLSHDEYQELNGAELLDQSEAFFRTYTVQPTEHAYVALAVYTAYTHAAAEFDFAPRLVLTSAEKRSGKTRTMEIGQALSHNPLVAANASVAAIYRSLGGDDTTTLFLDEADTIFGTKLKAEQNEDLRGLLNAGFQKGTGVLRTVGPTHEVATFETFAPAVLAAIGKLPDTITDRAINIRLRRRKATETVAQYRLRRDQPLLHEHRRLLSAWVNEHREEIRDAEPHTPLEDRAADTWEPLLAVADIAGGEWPARLRVAALALTKEAEENDSEQSEGLELLSDIREVLNLVKADFVPTANLLQLLKDKEESRWADIDLTARRLSDRLKAYQIRPQPDSAGKVRGYKIRQFEDVFARYLPTTRPNPSEPSDTPPDQEIRTDGLKASDTSNRQTKSNRQSKTPGQTTFQTVQTRSDTTPTETPNVKNINRNTDTKNTPNTSADKPTPDANGYVNCQECGKHVKWRYAQVHDGQCFDCSKKESA